MLWKMRERHLRSAFNTLEVGAHKNNFKQNQKQILPLHSIKYDPTVYRCVQYPHLFTFLLRFIAKKANIKKNKVVWQTEKCDILHKIAPNAH